MNIQWESGYAIRAALNGDSAVISANREGLHSLAGQLTALAEAHARQSHSFGCV